MTITREQIEQMQAGREMDELIVVDVMGWTRPNIRTDNVPPCPYIGDYFKPSQELEQWRSDYHWRTSLHGSCWKEPFKFSTDISAAWEVVEKLHAITISRHYEYWLCRFGNNESVQGITAPLAICRAALLAYEGVTA